ALSDPDQNVDDQYQDHSKFITRGSGGIAVTTIDRLNLRRDRPLAIKIDVEGEEMNVLRGAQETLSAVPNFAIQVEAHADVEKRTNIDPRDFVRFVDGIRNISIKIVHDRDGVIGDGLSMETSFFEQYPVKSCDIL